ncbi:MAG: penicillin acylase family protein [Chloroflexota bacterium]
MKPSRRKRIVKIFSVLGMVLLALAIFLGGAGIWLVRRPWPKTNGTLAVAGLQAPLEIVRDSWGVPHIYAQNEHDLLFAQGYVHAQDRLWQMEFGRRYASGTLSEVLGEAAVWTDRYMRNAGLRRVAEGAWANATEEEKRYLEAYAEGVNAYVETHRHRLPVEFSLTDSTPQPWTPVDTLAWGNVLAMNMAENLNAEVTQALLIAAIGEARGTQLFPLLGQDEPTIVPAETQAYTGFSYTRIQQPWIEEGLPTWGSNNWVVAGSRTTTGKPFLANDTHVNLYMPSVWYENGLHGAGFDSTGFTLPGVPLVIMGGNQQISWGITNLSADIQDLYLERLDDPVQPSQYEFQGKWYDLEIIHETLRVKDAPAVEFSIYVTNHGPLDPNTLGHQDSEPASVRWSLYEGETIFRSLIKLNRASNWQEFREALREWDTLCLNFVYADAEGNIGYQAAGRIPIRAKQHAGVLPVPGWSGAYEWQGFIDYDDLPFLFNPPDGFISTANNRVIADYPYPLYYGGTPSFRAARIQALLNTKERFSVEDMRAIQSDTYSMPAEIFRPYLLKANPGDDLQAQALELVRQWDGYLEPDRLGAVIYEAWFKFLVQNTIGDELSLAEEWLAESYLSEYSNRQILLMESILPDTASAWFDNIQTEHIETRDEIVQKSFTDALAWLRESYGPKPQDWRWERVHTSVYTHQPLGQSGVPLLEGLFNGPRLSVRGGQFTVVQTWFPGTLSFNGNFGSSQRMLIDLANPDQSFAVNTTGQSEHLFHPHRADQIALWQDLAYHPMRFTREAIEANAENTLTLTPR